LTPLLLATVAALRNERHGGHVVTVNLHIGDCQLDPIPTANTRRIRENVDAYLPENPGCAGRTVGIVRRSAVDVQFERQPNRFPAV
jgi:hypothetical protein